MPYPTSQVSPLVLLAALQQQQQQQQQNPGGYGAFNPASLAPAQLLIPQRGQNVAGGMGGGMGQIPVIGAQNGSGGGMGGLGSLQQIAALKNLFGGSGGGNGMGAASGSLLNDGSFWGSQGGSALDRLFGLFGSSGTNAPNYLSDAGSGLTSFAGTVE